MHASMATEAGDPDVPNEDWAGLTPSLIAVLDGVTSVSSNRACAHGTPWYVRQLGGRLLGGDRGEGLAVIAARAIAGVAALHPGCDLASGAAPSAAIAMLRFDGDRAEYLVLADVSVVLETANGIEVISDGRVEASVAGVDPGAPDVGEQITARRKADRNRPGGYWVAAADPAAAHHAITGSVTGLRRAAVVTDGASRLADMFGAMWADVLAMDPADLIAMVRKCEATDPDRQRYPRFKVSDDATAVLWET